MSNERVANFRAQAAEHILDPDTLDTLEAGAATLDEMLVLMARTVAAVADECDTASTDAARRKARHALRSTRRHARQISELLAEGAQLPAIFVAQFEQGIAVSVGLQRLETIVADDLNGA